MTIQEEFNDFKNIILTFIGDGNNVANSLILCGALLGIEVRIACPKGYEPNSLIISKAKQIYKNKNLLKVTNNPIVHYREQMLFIQMSGHLWEKKIKKKEKKKILMDLLLMET